MIRILAISDIHNNVPCVRMLRAQEQNRFDVIAVVGDIGSHRASEIFEILNTFDCPVVYVFGNWDYGLTNDDAFGPNCRLLHFNFFETNGFVFTGNSHLPPSAHPATASIPEDFSGPLYRAACRREIMRLLWQNGIDLNRVIYLNHYQDTWLAESFPGLLAHMFGHIHTFSVSLRKGAALINVSALDRMVTVYPKGRQIAEKNMRNANAGNYAVVEIDDSQRISVECQLLTRRYEGYIYRDNSHQTLPLIVEESEFGDANASFFSVRE